MANGRHVLLVMDRDPETQRLLRAALASGGYGVTVAPGAADAIGHMRRRGQDVILVDSEMDAQDRWAFTVAYEQISAPLAPLIFFTPQVWQGNQRGHRDAVCRVAGGSREEPVCSQELLDLLGTYSNWEIN